jgi:dipeptidase D
MDMVCEKNADVEHDFLKDGLKLSVKDGYLWAEGTTLGGDNGIAVAMILALLDTDKHPKLECLFTVSEEIGLDGAKAFDCSVVTAKRMINLDSEEDWQITAGCAGGCRAEVEFSFEKKSIDADATLLNISVTGLSGGHSGAEIHLGKTNALVALGRILGAIWQKERFCLVSLSGGGKDNAIAREAFATIAVKDESKASLAAAEEVFGIRKELSGDDEGMVVNIDVGEGFDKCIDEETTGKIVAFMVSVKSGVLKMSNDIAGLVEYSRNFGVANTFDDCLRLIFSARSSIESQIDLSYREMDTLSALVGARCRHYARYPGWEYAPVSPLREAYSAAYKKLFGKDLSIGVIHAGLECGILSSKMSGLDAISVGPNMYDIHSPSEHLDLASCERIWRTLLEVVKA